MLTSSRKALTSALKKEDFQIEYRPSAGKRAWDFFLRPRYCFLSVVKGLTITGAKRAVGCTKVCNFYHKKIFLSYFFIAQTGFSALYLLLVPFFPIFPFSSFALAASPVLSSCKPADPSAVQMRRRHTCLSANRPRLSRRSRDRRRDSLPSDRNISAALLSPSLLPCRASSDQLALTASAPAATPPCALCPFRPFAFSRRRNINR